MKKAHRKTKWTETPTLFIFSVLSACTAFVLYAFRLNYIYIDTAVFNGLSATLLGLNIFSAVLLFGLFILKAYEVRCKGVPVHTTKAFRIFTKLGIILTCVLCIYVIGNLCSAGTEFLAILQSNLKAGILPFAAILCILLLLWGYPLIKSKKLQRAISLIIAVAIILVSVSTLLPCTPYKFLSDPMVIDNGTSYAVVFATSDTGSGFVEYTYQGESYKAYDETAGWIKGSSKIHTVQIPKEHLNGNTYHVGSVRILEERSYGSKSGKTILSKDYTFTAPNKETQTYLTISDWHLRLEKAYAAIGYVGAYDGVILLGDAVPGLSYEDDVVKNIVVFGGNVSKGTMPVIYVRGNHETRGGYAAKLPDYLGMDSFYYTTTYGDYNFLILDSGEDKKDSHPEYGGMVNYGEYRKDMVSWLGTLPQSDKKTITLVHDSDICIEDDLRAAAQTELKRLNATNILSGHYHICEFKQENGFNIYTDGGHKKGTYIASKLTLGKGGYRLEAWNNSGEQVFQKDLAW